MSWKRWFHSRKRELRFVVVFTLACGIFFSALPSVLSVGIDAQRTRRCLPQTCYIIVKYFMPWISHYVAFHSPPAMEPHTPRGQTVVKKIVGFPGDLLTVRGEDFFVNGRYVGTAERSDSNGNAVTHVKFWGSIPPERYFVMGTMPHSYDSRYWGFLEERWIIGSVFPLF